MKKVLTEIGVLLLFYSVIIFGVVLLNQRFMYLNSLNDADSSVSYIAMNE